MRPRRAGGLRRLQRTVRNFMQSAEVAKLFRLASTTADLAGAKSVVEKTAKILEQIGGQSNASFRPPFMNLGADELGVYRVALADAFPDAASPEGAILLFEHSRSGRLSHSWLNVGEEMKLEPEAKDIESRKQRLLKARSAQGLFLTVRG
jgi:hypothetical protein